MTKKVLIAAPIYDGMEYCFQEFITRLKLINYPTFDIAIFDNSKNKNFFEKIKNISKIKAFYDDTKEETNMKRLISSRNKILNYAIKENYDYLLMIDSDVMVKPEILNQLLEFQKDVISGIYFNYFKFGNELVLLPVVYVSISQNEFESLKTKNQLPQGAKSKDDIRRHLNKYDIKDQDFLEVRIPAAGCLLLSKKAFSSGAQYGLEKIEPNQNTSDEIYFFNKLRTKGFRLYCCPKVSCGHAISKKYEKVPKHLD